jgi:hypothetical protein
MPVSKDITRSSRAIFLGSVGAIAGYLLLPYLIPPLISVALNWVYSRPFRLVAGLAIGSIIAILVGRGAETASVGGLIGMLAGRLISVPLSLVIQILWYNTLRLRWPTDTLLLGDISALFIWFLTVGGSVLVGFKIRNKNSEVLHSNKAAS